VNDDLSALLRRSLAYLGAGVVATVPMTVVMLIAQAVGRMGTQPPRRIVDEAVERQPGPRPSGATRGTAAAVLHFVLGGIMAVGLAPFLAIVRRMPRSIGTARGVIAGAAFGTSLYALNYAGLAPALGVLPPPAQDRPGRQPAMVAAHLVYGVATAMVVRALEGRLVRTVEPRVTGGAELSGTRGARAGA
jgi:hypothetical protein